DSRLKREDVFGVFAGAHVPRSRLVVRLGALVVLGDAPCLLAGPPVAARAEPVGDLLVVPAAQPLEHALVRHVVQQRVTEDVLVGVCERRRLAGEDELALVQAAIWRSPRGLAAAP